ncbi:MAG: SprT-like domain-containing protein [Gemmatimonadaceae bacterium]
MREKFRLERLRQLWTQCDLFEQAPSLIEIARPAPPRPDISSNRLKRRTSGDRERDAAVIARLQDAHAEYNMTLFSGELRVIGMRISRRMKNRLGHYMVAGSGQAAEIAMSLKHLERDPWDDVLHTLVHEMVHQWQDQHGLALDHGHAFRVKAREVGISARATRPASGTVQPRLAARTVKRRRK